MNAATKRPSVFAGAATGLGATCSLSALFYAGHRLASVPFPPFALFDWLTRQIPGPILTRGIDLMVRAIRALGIASTDVAAKAAEQTVAVVLFLALGTVIAAIAFAALRPTVRWSAEAGASICGLALAAPLLLVLRGASADSTGVFGPSVFTVAGCVAWGWSIGWAYARMSSPIRSAPEPGRSSVPSVERVNRRQFLVRFGTASAMITVAGTSIGALLGRRNIPGGKRWSQANPLPNAGARVKPVPGTRPEFTPLERHYRIDIRAVPPEIRADTWRLQVAGLVDHPRAMTLDQLRAYESLSQFVTLSCISNPVGGDLISTTRWTGVSLQRLVRDWHLNSAATYLKLTSADRYFEYVSLADIERDERIMLAYAWDGVPLPRSHGFPLRIYIPDRYGMKQPKWIMGIDAVDREGDGYWVERGWDRVARVKSTSVIDTVRPMEIEGGKRLAIGGIAFAGARGISRVELRIDQGAWSAAELRDPLSPTTWVVWRHEVPFEPGEHTITVRCVDGAGAPQVTANAPPHPSGASGLQQRHVRIA